VSRRCCESPFTCMLIKYTLGTHDVMVVSVGGVHAPTPVIILSFNEFPSLDRIAPIYDNVMSMIHHRRSHFTATGLAALAAVHLTFHRP